MSKGKITIIVLVIFMVLAASIGGIYAYYSINQKEKTDLASIIASMEKEINKNVETITHLEQTLELNGLELEDLIKKEVEYKTIIDDRTKIQKEYITRKEIVTRTLTDKQTIYRTKTETKTKIEKEIKTLTEQLENTNPSEIETITEIQEKIVEKEKEKVVIEKEIQEIEKVIIEYEKELVEVEEKINVLTININQLNEMITELNVSINVIGKTEEETRELIKSLEDENAALTEELAYAKAEIENLKANAEAKYQNIIDNLNGDISNLQSRLTETENELNSYKEANISLKQTIINLENEIEDLNNNSNTSQVEELLQQIEEKNLEIENLNKIINNIVTNDCSNYICYSIDFFDVNSIHWNIVFEDNHLEIKYQTSSNGYMLKSISYKSENSINDFTYYNLASISIFEDLTNGNIFIALEFCKDYIYNTFIQLIEIDITNKVINSNVEKTEDYIELAQSVKRSYASFGEIRLDRYKCFAAANNWL